MDVWICLDYVARPDGEGGFFVDSEVIGVFLEKYKATLMSIDTKCDVVEGYIEISDDSEREILKCAM